MQEKRAGIRLDKWLWQARFFKTRSLAARQIRAGGFFVNDRKVVKPATLVHVQDHLRFPQARREREVRIRALGQRRGPASEAQQLYEDLAPAPAAPETPPPVAARKGRPTKRDRRAIVQMWRNDP